MVRVVLCIMLLPWTRNFNPHSVSLSTGVSVGTSESEPNKKGLTLSWISIASRGEK